MVFCPDAKNWHSKYRAFFELFEYRASPEADYSDFWARIPCSEALFLWKVKISKMSDSDSFTRFVSELWKVRALIVTTHATFRHKCRRNNNFRPQRMNPNFVFLSFRSGFYRFNGVEIWDAIKQFRRNCPFTPFWWWKIIFYWTAESKIKFITNN